METRLRSELKTALDSWKRYQEFHKGSFPHQFSDFLLKDILNYSKEELNDLTLQEYSLACIYSEDTYLRRDVAYVMSQVYSDKKDKGHPLVIEHPEIEDWIKEQYETASKGNKI
jgi:hypothetical protein